MKKRIIYIFILMLVVSLSATAQRHRHNEEFTDNYTQGIGWVHTPFLSNWFVTAEAGPRIYFGYEDGKAPLLDRVSWNFGGYVGRWVFPMVGIRVGGGYGTFTGFLSQETYYNNFAWSNGTHSYPASTLGYGTGECDMNMHPEYGNGAYRLGGYYKYDENNPDLFRQHWNAWYVSPDLMINLSYANFYNPNKIFTTYAYLGVSFLGGLNDTLRNSSTGKRIDPNTAAEGHVGIIENVRLGKSLRLFADVRFSLYSSTFDREIVPGVEKGLRSEDGAINVNFGLTYNFNLIGKKKYANWYREHIDNTLAEDAEAPSPEHLYTTHNVDINLISTTDTVWANDTISEYDPIFQRWVDSLAALINKDTIDKLLAQNCDTCPLRDILSRHLIPYEMVFFDLDRWDIHTSEALKIAKMARLMREYPKSRFLLLGSADSKTGTVKRNEFLSVNRADVVYNKLVFEYDIPAEQLQRVYLGGILDYEPFELNRATVIIMEHPRLMEKFMELRSEGRAGGSEVEID